MVSQDTAGRTTSDACVTYAYDGFDRMASTTQKTLTGCATDWSAATTTSYSYDGLDRQRSSTVTGSATTGANDATRSFYDGLSDTLIGQVDAQNGSHSDPNTYYQLDPVGALVGLAQSGYVPSWLDDDGQGSITNETITTGTKSCAVKYDPFGNPLSPSTSGNGVCANGTRSAISANAVWYRGYTRDAAAGSYQLGTRTYQPGIAGFTTPDTHRVSTPNTDLSVGTDPLTANTYTYVNGNPVNAYDPTGHRPQCGEGCDNGQWIHDGKGGVDPSPSNKAAAREQRDVARATVAAKKAIKAWGREHQGMSPTEVGDMLFKNLVYDYTACADGVGVGCVLENSVFLTPLVGKVGKGGWRTGTALWAATRGGGKTSLAVMMKTLDDAAAAASRRAETIKVEQLRDANRTPRPSRSGGDSPPGTSASSGTPLPGRTKSNSSPGNVTLSLKYKEGWSPAQRAAADSKVANLNARDLVVTPATRNGTSAASRYRAAGRTVPQGADIDHVQDLQLGGLDDLTNLSPLDASVNRSLGPQIAHQIRNLPVGSRIGGVTIGER